MRFRHAWVLLLVCAACQRGAASRSAAAGTERGDCRPDKTCDVGLLCLSDLCVAPPAADCKNVAEGLASLDLGNYAAVEERAPVVAKYKASCETNRVSKEEGACLDKARDKWTAAQCVPRMFRDMMSSTSDCGKVIDKLRQLMAQQMASTETNPQAKQMYEMSLRVMGESCEQDHWPKAFIDCALSGTQQSDLNPCQQQMPPALQQKIQERVTAAMQQQTR